MKILLVDDSKSARYALRLQLQRHGVEVETADSAESAFEILRTQLPDAILMDHMMPGLNGFEAFEVIREDPRTTHIPVIMCTSHEEADFIATAKKKGVFGILPKSAAPELLPGILDQVRDHLGAQTPAPSTVETAAPTAAAPGLSEATVTKMIDTRLEERLSTMLTPMLEALRRDLAESLVHESQQIIDNRLAEEQAAKRSAPPVPTMADLQAISTRLATETLPDLLKRGIEDERGQIMEQVDKLLRESRSKAAHSQEGRSEAADEAIAMKVAASVRRETQELIDTSTASTREALQAVEKSFGATVKQLYLAIGGAAILGVGAAALVFFLLGSP